MLDYLLVLNKRGVRYFSLVLNQKFEESFFLGMAMSVLIQNYVEQKTVPGRKEINEYIVEFRESKNQVIYVTVLSNIGLMVQTGDFFDGLVASLEEEFVNGGSEVQRKLIRNYEGISGFLEERLPALLREIKIDSPKVAQPQRSKPELPAEKKTAPKEQRTWDC